MESDKAVIINVEFRPDDVVIESTQDHLDSLKSHIEHERQVGFQQG